MMPKWGRPSVGLAVPCLSVLQSVRKVQGVENLKYKEQTVCFRNKIMYRNEESGAQTHPVKGKGSNNNSRSITTC